jgi:hypothetical protein
MSGISWARRVATGLLGKARALFHGLGPKGEHPSRVMTRAADWAHFDAAFAKMDEAFDELRKIR